MSDWWDESHWWSLYEYKDHEQVSAKKFYSVMSEEFLLALCIQSITIP